MDTLYALEVAGLSALRRLDVFGHATPDVITAVLTEGGRMASDVLAPLNGIGDREGCVRQADGSVTTPTGFKAAYREYTAAGWTSLLAPQEYGGQALPRAVWLSVEQFAIGANLGFACYNALTGGAAAAILANGTDAQKRLYVPKLVSGEWSGTMNLTEPHCGTDLSLIKTVAKVRGDAFVISGTKIFISSGEHDLTDNIIHLVLAKTDGEPDGLKGLSLFLVPKFLPDSGGNPGQRNSVTCGSIERKMGLHSNSTCVMNYENATGYLLGEKGRGLAAIFVMVNMARLHVGVQGLGVADAAYQHAARYARERRQGRAPSGPRDPQMNADTLLVHPDVRRMLMECRALIEGSRALCLWAAVQADWAHHGDAAEDRNRANGLLAFITPVVKGFVTDLGYRCATTAQQIFGGHGYIWDNRVEQLVRDSRIAMLYEGANGVQAMDLVSRKILHNGGVAVDDFMSLVNQEIEATDPSLHHLCASLGRAADDFKQATAWIRDRTATAPEDVGAAAYSYMELLGYLTLGWLWLTMANCSSRAIASGLGDLIFHRAKIATGEFFFQRLLPEAMALRAKIETGASTLMALADETF